MTTVIIVGVVAYLLIGGFFAAVSGEDDTPPIFFITLLWPVLVFGLVIGAALVGPYIFWRWVIGKRSKR